MSDFQEIISTKNYLLFEGAASFKYGADLNFYLTEKKGYNHFKHRIYYDVEVEVTNLPRKILGSEIKSLYASKFELQKIKKGICVKYNQQEFFFNADHIYIEINAKPDHVQTEGEELFGDFVNIPVIFVMHYIDTKVVCKKDIPTGKEETREDGIYKEYTTGEFIEGTEICDTYWEKEKVNSIVEIETSISEPTEEPIITKRPDATFSPPNPPPNNGCLPLFFLLLIIGWAAFMIYLTLKNGSFMPILFGIGIPLLLFGLGAGINRLSRFASSFGSIFRWSLNLLLFIVIFSVFDGLWNVSHQRKDQSENNRSDKPNDAIEVTEVNPNDDRNSSVVNEENEVRKPFKLISLKWEDYSGNKYDGTFKLLIEDINKSTYNLRRLEYENYSSFTDVYANISDLDKNYLLGLFQMLDSIKDKNQLSKREFANTIVTMVQSIEYVLILDKSCEDPYNRRNPVIRELLDSGIECEGPAPFGLKTPTEFLSTTHGDCDTRTLLLYTIFKHYRYDVGIINSEFYGHSMLGLSLEGVRGMYKSYNGKKYYFWETTQIGPRLGELQREVGNINYWNITLN